MSVNRKGRTSNSREKIVSAVEKLYRNFCVRLADVCESEAKVYEEHPGLRDSDFQFISSLRAKRNEWREQLQRVEAAHPDREA
jgi:hypothetical protein